MPDDIADLLKTLYETNTAYHNIKERVVWLAGTIYLTFSTLLIAWYLRYQDKIPECVEKGHKIVVLSVIFALTVVFIIRQTREKVHSSVLSDQHFALMRKPPNRRTHAGLKKANTYSRGMWRAFWDFISMGWSGHLILGVVYIFFLAQQALVCEVSITRKIWIWPIPAFTILFPLIISWGRRIRQCCEMKKKLQVKRCCEVKKKLRNIGDGY